VAVTLRRKLALVAGLYFVEGFPMGIYSDVWRGVYLRQAGFSIEAVGAVSALQIAWSAKVLWSPLVDRFGDWRHWIAGALAAMALALFAVPSLGAGAVFFAIGCFCLASATQDIAIDAYAIPLTARGEEGPLNAARITAYRCGKLAVGAGALVLADALGWRFAHAALAGFAALAALAVLAAPRVQSEPAARRDWAGMLRTWRRPGLASALAFLLLHRLGDLALAPMVGVFWLERGFSATQIAALSTTAGTVAALLGAAVGGVLVARATLSRALFVGALLAVGSNLAYALAALAGAPREAVVAAGVVESFCGGVAGVAFMSLLVRACDRRHAAVHYAALTALYPLSGALVGSLSGVGVAALGFAGYFALTGLLALPSLWFLRGAVRWAEETPA
jgi:PAT family beta-lactamase induction signal transducer AmpG